MSDTVKLIVILSKGQYENLKNIQCGSIGSRMIVNAVMNGTPLDDVKAERNEDIPVKFIPINVDSRGYADIFECSKCGGVITTSILTKELDYDFCPWCGGKDE